jgi:hypothetical protein
VTTAPVSTAARVDELVDRACRETGLDAFGGDTWREGLEVLIGSALAESSFTELGEDLFYGGHVQTLKNRLQIEDWFARHPEIADEDVELELLGVGFPRTGSTALSHLLGEDTSVRSLRMWESAAPCPPPGVSADDDAERIAAAEAVVAAQQVALPRFRAMLPQSATGPIEDHELMALEFKTQLPLAFARLPTYARWFLDCDMEPTYRYERRVLQLLQWRCPPTRWQLKSPTHTLFLDAFAKVFPRTRFVMTHRDVARVLPSVADLYCTLLDVASTDVDPHEVGALNLEQWGTALDRVLEFRTGADDAQFFDLGFTRFQSDPIGQVRELYDWLGRDLSTTTEQRMLTWLAENPRDKHGVHTYDGETFGISESILASRFGAYRRRFASLLT